jgi:large subunit ribosomal protein L4
MEVSVYNIAGKETGKISLPKIFETKAKAELLHEIVISFLANQRAGTHSTLTRGEVTGGGAKPWKQKGTGRARSGSIRSPLWRKGGIIFGPKPRNYYSSMSQKKKQVALAMALNEKVAANDLIVVEDITVNEAKTKNVANILKSLKIEKGEKILLVADVISDKLKIAGKNIGGLVLERINSFNAYQVLWADKMIVTSKGIAEIDSLRSVK